MKDTRLTAEDPEHNRTKLGYSRSGNKEIEFFRERSCHMEINICKRKTDDSVAKTVEKYEVQHDDKYDVDTTDHKIGIPDDIIRFNGGGCNHKDHIWVW